VRDRRDEEAVFGAVFGLVDSVEEDEHRQVTVTVTVLVLVLVNGER